MSDIAQKIWEIVQKPANSTLCVTALAVSEKCRNCPTPLPSTRLSKLASESLEAETEAHLYGGIQGLEEFDVTLLLLVVQIDH